MIPNNDSFKVASGHAVSPLAAIKPKSNHPDVLHESEELVIRRRAGWRPIDWKELFRYRELLWNLTMRDVTIRYKQSALGSTWAVIQPLTMMLIFTLVFGM